MVEEIVSETLTFTSGLEETGIERIRERLLDLGNYLLITFSTERSEGVMPSQTDSCEVWVFKVTRVFDRYVKEYDELPSIPAEGELDYAYLGEEGHGEGEDILRVEDDPFHIMHFGFTPEPNDLKVWSKITTMNWSGTGLDRYDPSDYPQIGSDTDYISGDMIHQRLNPPKLTEMVSFKNHEEGHMLQFGFENPTEEEMTDPKMWLVGHSYKVKPVTDREERIRIIRESLKARDDREIQLTNVKVGGVQSYRLGEIIPEEWQEEANYEILDEDILMTEEEGTVA